MVPCKQTFHRIFWVFPNNFSLLKQWDLWLTIHSMFPVILCHVYVKEHQGWLSSTNNHGIVFGIVLFFWYDVHKCYLVRCDWNIKLTCIVSNVIVWIYGTDFIPLHHCVVPCLSVVWIMEYIIQYLWFNIFKDCSDLKWNYDKK